MTIKFCSRCHKEAFQIKEEGDNIKVIQGTSTVLNLNKTSTVEMTLNCPSGHPVSLEIGERKDA